MGAESPHETLRFYWASRLGAIRQGQFKYHVRRPISVGYAMAPLMFQMPLGPWLFDLSLDPDESYDVSELYPEVTSRLAARLEKQVADDRTNPRGFLASRP